MYDALADVYDWLVPEALLEPEGSVAAFDAVFCVGNSITHARGRAGRRAALAAMRGALGTPESRRGSRSR